MTRGRRRNGRRQPLSRPWMVLPLLPGAVTAVDFPVSAGNITCSVATEVSDQLCDFFDRSEALDEVFLEQLFGIDHPTRDQPF